ncbi:MAG: hypothetical protein KGZ89_00070 [Actinobacteria bacterium]|nr:hypothetical protein [Actinomycetota bacterium]
MLLGSFYALFENNIISVCERLNFRIEHIIELRVNGALAVYYIRNNPFAKGKALFAVIDNPDGSKSSARLNIEMDKSWKHPTLILFIDGDKVDLSESTEAEVKKKVQEMGYFYEK